MTLNVSSCTGAHGLLFASGVIVLVVCFSIITIPQAWPTWSWSMTGAGVCHISLSLPVCAMSALRPWHWPSPHPMMSASSLVFRLSFLFSLLPTIHPSFYPRNEELAWSIQHHPVTRASHSYISLLCFNLHWPWPSVLAEVFLASPSLTLIESVLVVHLSSSPFGYFTTICHFQFTTTAFKFQPCLARPTTNALFTCWVNVAIVFHNIFSCFSSSLDNILQCNQDILLRLHGLDVGSWSIAEACAVIENVAVLSCHFWWSSVAFHHLQCGWFCVMDLVDGFIWKFTKMSSSTSVMILERDKMF